MPIFLSDELGLGKKVDDLGTFDQILDFDSNYYINIKRLKQTQIPEFKQSYEKVNKYFSNIGILLAASSGRDDRAFKQAYKIFNFPEVNGVGLGFSQGKYGSGFGPQLREQVIKDAKEIIDKGVNEPEIFHLIGLFEDNIGPDRLSDMVATIIYDDITQYTVNINQQLGINVANYPSYEFDSKGIMINPYKGCKILLLPKDILHELPIASGWSDIDRVCAENDVIRQEFNCMIGEKWNKLTTNRKKTFIRDNIFMNPDKLTVLLDKYKGFEVKPYNFVKDEVGEYLITRIANEISHEYPIEIKETPTNSMETAVLICNKFKDLIENNKAYELLYVDGKSRGEKIVQRAFFCIAVGYCEANNLDVSPESNTGRGPVDFKMSRGTDKTIVEIKLTSNKDLERGFTIQLEEYSKSEKTDKKIFLIVDNGGSQTRLRNVIKIYEESKKNDRKTPELIIIDAKPKESASKYKG